MKTTTATKIEQPEPEPSDLAVIRESLVEALHLIRVVAQKWARVSASMDVSDLFEWVDRKVGEISSRLSAAK